MALSASRKGPTVNDRPHFSGDMKQQVTLRFETKEEAVAYCEREAIPYQVIEPKESMHRQVAYADNFAFRRGEPWTH
jgi:hypothetical protein